MMKHARISYTIYLKEAKQAAHKDSTINTKAGGNMLTFLIILGILWIALKITTFFVEIPFKIIKVIFSALGSTVFWVILIALIIVAIL